MADRNAPATWVAVVTDTLHGVEIADPYRWLEDGESAETETWTEAQNARTAEYLGRWPGRAALAQRLETLLSLPSIGVPTARQGKYFYTRRNGTQNQPVYYVKDGVNGTERTLIDPNGLSDDGTVSVDWWFPSRDGGRLAYGLSQSGDERSTLYVLEVETGEKLADTIPHTRYSSVAWLPDNSGFYYTRYPSPGSVPAGEENYYKKVYFHHLGTDWESDPLVFGEGLAASEMPSVQLSPDGKWILVTVSQGWAKSEMYFRLASDAPGTAFQPLVAGADALFSGQLIDNDTLFVLTNENAPRFQLLSVDLNAPAREHWKVVIPEGPDALQAAPYLNGRFVALMLHNATSRLTVYDTDGAKTGEIALPGLGTVAGPSGQWDSDEIFYGYSSYDSPLSIYRYDLSTGAQTLWDKIDAGVDPAFYDVKQEWYSSKDGTKVSLFVVHKKGLEKTGANPTLLSGYGGFNISLTPGFSPSLLLWLEAGGIYAVANLRGGSEYGEEWHTAGMKERKQNVFDDFLAAAEHLIHSGYTNPEKLAIQGGSNGGLLVGVALTQRPDLFRAVICAVPLLDMVRYHQFLIAKLWVPEYGSADDPAQFAYLHAYSPYHHVQDGTRYPAILIETATSDSRVHPLHAFKMAALLQAKTGSDYPVLLRVESKAGHGVGKPLTKRIEEAADTWSFLFGEMGM